MGTGIAFNGTDSYKRVVKNKKMTQNFDVDKRFPQVVPFYRTDLSVVGIKVSEGRIVDRVVPVYPNTDGIA